MSKPKGKGKGKGRGASTDEGAAMIEYVMILGFITALVIFFFGLLYPAAGEDIETLLNAWGDRLAGQIAGDPIDADSDAWGVN
jgi:Flp pilus assembly pilin Flp